MASATQSDAKHNIKSSWCTCERIQLHPGRTVSEIFGRRHSARPGRVRTAASERVAELAKVRSLAGVALKKKYNMD